MAEPAASDAERRARHGELVNPDGSWKYTNALAHETSPYLLQHAHNPVEWYPWGPEAFELARRTGKPIFLSIGYSTCYWCHVMEREVFEDPRLAGLLNERFVSIKVDREERPDVDDLYMVAVQAMTGRGGWPMSVFLTPPGAGGPEDPGLKPFWAGTYIPPVPAHGMPGFGQVVTALSDAWQDQRERVLAQAERVAEAVQGHLSRQEERVEPSVELVQAAVDQLLGSYDPENGGFGSAPKFPQPSNLLFLFAVYRTNPDEDLWEALGYTLERMARGGLYDQVGGGFHRYATDEAWLVPHFEKMLYDNGQLVEAYAVAQEVRPDAKDPQLYARVVRETCDYVLREMTDASGAFWSAQDAEVGSREGANYLWTAEQVREAVGGDEGLAELAVVMYGLDQGPNFRDPHHPDDPPMNVLFLPRRLEELAEARGLGLEDVVAVRGRINRALLAVRGRRPQPATDDKVIAGWNGIMIGALARAGRALREPRYVAAAERAAEAVLESMWTADGGLLRTMRRGRAGVPGFLEDYAYFAHGLIELYRATQEERWLIAARGLMREAEERFSAVAERGGGYYDTLGDQEDLFVRTMGVYDGAIPSGNSQMVHNLIDLYGLTGDALCMDRAVRDLWVMSGAMRRSGSAMAHMQHALLRGLEVAPDRLARGPASVEAGGEGLTVVGVGVEPELLDLMDPEAGVRVTLRIAGGYHLNGPEADEAGLVPTRLVLENAPGLGLEVRYPAGVVKRYPFADEAIEVYEGTVVLEAKVVEVEEDELESAQGVPRLVLSYQACTETSCLEPTEVELPVLFEGSD
jgi:hypothetical protein